ncbi:MAG: hydrogenase maturation protease [Isosphaeraceae bacterium]
MNLDPRDENLSTLVIGVGNTLRKDDGVGPSIAEVVESWRLPGVSTLATFSLTPELATIVAESRHVIFADARLASDDSERCEVETLNARPTSNTLGHALDPRTLLSLAGRVYDRWPEALRVTVPAMDLSLGEGFSPTARREMAQALLVIAAELAKAKRNESCTKLE